MEMLDYTGKNLIFVVGCPRSGTTWLQRLLMSHPKIHSGQESNVFDMFVGHQLRMWKLLMSKKEGRPVGLPAYFKESDYKRILKSYLMDLLAPMIGSLPETDYFLEKTPGHALFLDEIKELLPDARFIYILRDVRDVVASLVAASRGWGKSWAPSSVEASAKTWVRYLETVNQFKSKVSADNFFEVRYEQLNSPLAEEVLAQIFQFLKLDYSVEQIKAAIDANRIDKSAKSGGTPIPVFGEFENRFGPVSKEPEGFFRKGKNGAWKEDLTESDLKIIYQIAGKYISDKTPVQTMKTPKTAVSEGDPTRQSYHKQHRDVKQLVAQFRSLHIPIEDKTIDVADFMRWMEDFRELTDRYQKMGNVCIEKCLEHYLAAALLGLKPGDNYIDVAGSASNFAEILRKRGINAYKLDIAYPKGIHGIQIGADAGNTQLADRSIQGMSLQCAFECFEGDADIRFIQEGQRILKPGGRVVITPLYVDSIYHNITSSLCDQSQIRFDDGALKVWRDDQYKAPFSRHYSPQAFRDRILKQINPDHTYKIIHYTNLDELRKVFPGQVIYCDLLFYLERTSQMAIQSVAPSSDRPRLSVVIPTRNRAASMDRVLNSLVSLQNPGWPYEIIMVDNGSTDTTRQVAESYQQTSLPQLRYVFEHNPGLHNGRHRGAFEARGQVLCYLDDDVKVDPLWLKSVVETFETTGAVLVGGKILPEYEQTPPDWVKEFVKSVGNYGYNIGQLTLIDLGEQIREIDPIYVWGANFSIRKDVLFECGGFRPDSMPKELLDLRGDGETGLSRAIKQKGYKAFYHPRAMVRHCISKDRLTVEYFCARMFSQGISDSFTEIRNAGKLPNPVVSAAWEAYQNGKIHHRQIVQNNPNLLSWITRKDYFSECQSKTPAPVIQSQQKIENKTVQMVAGD